MTKREIRGYIYAAIASVALANSFIFSKLAFSEVDFYQFGFFWFLIGTIWNFLYVLTMRHSKKFSFRASVKKINKELLAVSLLEAVATGLFYYAIFVMENPGIVSFIGNVGPVFVVIFGVIFLKESFNKVQFIGIILAIGGVFIISLKGFSSFSELLISGSEYVVLAAFLFSIATIIARKKRKTIDPAVLSLVRALILFISFLILVLIMDTSLNISGRSWVLLSLGSFLEVFIVIVFAYKSLQYIKAFKTSIIISTKGIFALLSAYFFLSLTPLYIEVIGGIVSIIGVILVSFERRNK